MHRHSRQQIVIRNGIAVLEENAVVRDLLLGRRHVCLSLDFLLELLNGVAEADVDRQQLAVQLPFWLVAHVGHLHLNGHRTLEVEEEDEKN